jgi:hypothetical protein
MKQIILSNGGVTLVDDEDYERFANAKWVQKASARAGLKYAYASGHDRTLHREIMQPPEGLCVDHINGDGLDNRKSNLRICTSAENSKGQRVLRRGGSRFKGVYWNKRWKKWVAQIRVNYKLLSLGGFDEEEKAARAYNDAALKHFGEFARLNPVSDTFSSGAIA